MRSSSPITSYPEPFETVPLETVARTGLKVPSITITLQQMNRSQNTFDARIYLNGETIHYFMEGNKFQFRIEEIRMIGEFSAEPGALGADYFFTFIVKGIKKPLDIPAYAEGLFEVLADLRGILGGLDHPRLQMSTDFQSNILFPAEMAGKPYYEFLPESKPAINLPFLRNMVQIESIGKKLSPYLNLN